MHSKFQPLAHAPFLALALLLSTPFTLAQSGPMLRPAPDGVLKDFHVTKGTLQDLSLPKAGQGSFHVTVVLEGRKEILTLHPYDVRTKDFKLVVSDKQGLHVVPTPASVTYRGMVVGYEESAVAASLIDGQLQALILLSGEGANLAIQPVSHKNPTAAKTLHLIYNSRDNNVPSAKCGVADGVAHAHPHQGTGPQGILANKLAEIGIDADYHFYLSRGSSTTGTQNDVTTVINGMDVIYKRDVQIEYKVTQIVVRTSQVYTSYYPSTLLSQFRSRWLSYHGGIKRDLAHLFTGKNLSGSVIGVAYLGTVCTTGAYGLSQSSFTSNMSYRVGLTTHEVGHNWNAPHCNSSPPCYIMCSGLGGCNRSVTLFGSLSKSRISSFRNSRGCLSSPQNAPVITSLVPNTVEAFMGKRVTMNGSNLATVTLLKVGAHNLWFPFGFTIVSGSQITFQPPNASKTLMWQVVTADSPGGTSNPAPLYYRATHPPKLSVLPLVQAGAQLPFSFGSLPTNQWGLVVAPTNQTFPFLGFNWLQNFIVVTGGALDGAGLGSLVLPVPSSTTIGLKAYTQIVVIDFVKQVITGTSNIGSTVITK